ncbi:type III pantothenate kinase [Castellaniella sp.]|uniref:type III pantothenate kinase n=1 Tax=Castellaniella sp. TaxID=1955812 RepID=UPI002AFECBD5|nr:type III pantothenate kinase [Castellaniella sp.]
MKLLIDAGNTRAKIAWMTPGDPAGRSPAAPLDYAQLPELAACLPHRPQHILGSNVAGPDIRRRLDQACQTAWGLAIRWCDAHDGQDLLGNPYADVTRLGADRWLGLLGLLGTLSTDPGWRSGHPALLASFGTATTIDTITPGINTARPAFLGGLILPGPSLMAHSLAQGTAQLPLGEGRCVDFPQDTQDAIASGIAAAQAGALLRQWHLARDQAQGRAPQVFVCGGGWPTIGATVQAGLMRAQDGLQLPHRPPRVLDGPVLDGLACLAAAPRASAA